jgi:small subunit ribosomal protein S4
VDRPSFGLKVGDKIEVINRAKIREQAKLMLEKTASRTPVSWLLLDKDNFRGEVLKVPTREEISVPVSERLIVELYSK